MNRTVFIVGSNVMLMDEALKYPDTEFVLGLDLDQKTTLSFYHLSIHLSSCSSHLDLSLGGPGGPQALLHAVPLQELAGAVVVWQHGQRD